MSRVGTISSAGFCFYSTAHTDTTRNPRPGEVNGKQYHFITVQAFKDLIEENAFIEHAEFSGNFYGTSFETVRQVQEQGRRCILDIEAQVTEKHLFGSACCSLLIHRVFGKSKTQS